MRCRVSRGLNFPPPPTFPPSPPSSAKVQVEVTVHAEDTGNWMFPAEPRHLRSTSTVLLASLLNLSLNLNLSFCFRRLEARGLRPVGIQELPHQPTMHTPPFEV